MNHYRIRSPEDKQSDPADAMDSFGQEVRTVRVDGILKDDLAQDSREILQESGLFGITWGPLTTGSSAKGTLRVTDTGRWFGVQEEAKGEWEDTWASMSGYAHTTFKQKFQHLKAELRNVGFPVDDHRLLFDHCIVGLPRDELELKMHLNGLINVLRCADHCMSSHTRGRSEAGIWRANKYPFILVRGKIQLLV
ncbi:hypothetical protein PHYSODRAFT_261795 [Phytophthora sojae]|uniref:Uncharacterized protein n=1 Tax=Phytophthora sojae (strain P6497) TaxID=1094619 RepID=G5A158_PHYSP|nr:hypothetical protein PHYSODRAFT_261795 [Phytophthora sojae]EGZ10659.1 hypothetical protein PHYSODRAFT_261795 [Phytophthora sojae]|eukprot:XP_009533404.1 hypothetical protein PHYSODRAFT_261795 [Phytophthora sojae]